MIWTSLRKGWLLPALSVSALASNSVVNLSHYDEMHPDFVQMRREGVVAAIHEATYPPGQLDERYAERQDAALRAGLLWGAYHYANGTDPIGQADRFVSAVGRRWRHAGGGVENSGVLLVLDFEENRHYPGGTMRVDQAVAFVERIHQQTGKYPGLYVSENRIRKVLNGDAVSSRQREVLRRCWLWVANYHYRPQAIAPWNDWHLWQYTGDGVCDLPRSTHPIRVANIARAERNIFSGSEGALREFWARRAWRPDS